MFHLIKKLFILLSSLSLLIVVSCDSEEHRSFEGGDAARGSINESSQVDKTVIDVKAVENEGDDLSDSENDDDSDKKDGDSNNTPDLKVFVACEPIQKLRATYSNKFKYSFCGNLVVKDHGSPNSPGYEADQYHICSIKENGGIIYTWVKPSTKALSLRFESIAKSNDKKSLLCAYTSLEKRRAVEGSAYKITSVEAK